MEIPSDDRLPVSEDHLWLERSSTLDQHPEYRSLQVFYEMQESSLRPTKRRQTSSARCSERGTWTTRDRLPGS